MFLELQKQRLINPAWKFASYPLYNYRKAPKEPCTFSHSRTRFFTSSHALPTIHPHFPRVPCSLYLPCSLFCIFHWQSQDLRVFPLRGAKPWRSLQASLLRHRAVHTSSSRQLGTRAFCSNRHDLAAQMHVRICWQQCWRKLVGGPSELRGRAMFMGRGRKRWTGQLASGILVRAISRDQRVPIKRMSTQMVRGIR